MSAVEDAKRCIEGLNEWQGREGETDVSMLTVALEAQAHATLALAEQQRIANLIAFHSPMLYPNGDTASVGRSMWREDREQVEAVLFP